MSEKNKSDISDPKREVTHAFRKVSDRGNNFRKDHYCSFDQSAIYRLRQFEVTHVAKEQSDI